MSDRCKSDNGFIGRKDTEVEVDAVVISPGIAIGNICHYQTGSLEPTAFYKIREDEIETEISRLNSAIKQSKKDIKQLAESIKKMIGENEAKILESHVLILEDPQILIKLRDKLEKEKINVEHAVIDVFEEFEEVFDNMDDEYLRDRRSDFLEIKRRLLNHLSGEQGRFLCKEGCFTEIDEGRIIISKDFTSSMINLLKQKDIIGFITEHGAINSHAAILTRAAGVTYVSGINIIDRIKCGSRVIIDTDNNKIIVNPDDDTINRYKSIIDEIKKEELETKDLGPKISTSAGTEIEIYANLMSESEMRYINQYGFAGIGLLRTEFLFIDEIRFPSVNKQIEVYSRILDASNNKPVVFRLFDFGGDKKIKSLKFDVEDNPLLGLRGIRFLMKNRQILIDQVNAICKSAKRYNVKILYPMISNVNELKSVNKIIKEILNKYNLADKISIGMMFEVPSVFIEPEPFLKEIDFISIGSNDLVQYLFGVDRNNPNVSYLYNQDSDIIYRILKKIVEKVNKFNIDISLCGEINFDTQFIDNIVKIGIKKISFSPVGASRVISRIRQIKY